ncbi:glutamine-hydrolyzing carbamoyl-phosphate synthase small subunit [Buchnera aphidicola]|uniref:glutamine-hydrolyzing carbamoyl-phosphate synthase small subunit n=1 Tax=Buchnera aphidicola TaxID=9 RepID=UPI0034645511
MKKNAVLILEDGNIFYGKSIGIKGITSGEIVFNTSMTGYQEILTDPSYKNQIITFTAPHIGNVGTNSNDEESKKIHAKGIVIKKISLKPSNYRSKQTLQKYLRKNNKITITNIDTRKLTRIIRNKGSQKGCIISEYKNIYAIKNYQDAILLKKKIKKKTKSKKKLTTYSWSKKSLNLKKKIQIKKNFKYFNKKPINIIVYDFGVKQNILKMLFDRNCNITVVSKNTAYKKIKKYKPQGIFLSNGPGDPRKFKNSIKIIKKILKKKIPIFGICLGHQILALANKAKIKKMKFGHHGANHPVKILKNNKIIITSQNHNYVINEKKLPKNIKITHRSLFDNTIQGIKIKKNFAFSFQGHPEASPGPQDAKFLFDKFINMINKKNII